MLDGKSFCEKCKKIQPIIIRRRKETKEFNIGKIIYNKLYGTCAICEEEVYSLELSKKNKIEIEKKIKELEDEITILNIIEDSNSGLLEIQESDKELIKELEKILINKNKDK
ncbi:MULTISPECIES: hypothetical protein [unclassified Clostridium]|uniref:hypothetical protein n=1 Tax=unclassified Clostridium TaxID=2614128 RepID=UPI0025BFE943|nr:hypothetical protein [Clostridium sp.]MCI6693021.1 hypothetical protein [Clostridium sp.]MDY2630224.1 hypothetical protein [Clostridium sp.]MDY4251785.1 hypothetical protein [Clostridium sp.]